MLPHNNRGSRGFVFVAQVFGLFVLFFLTWNGHGFSARAAADSTNQVHETIFVIDANWFGQPHLNGVDQAIESQCNGQCGSGITVQNISAVPNSQIDPGTGLATTPTGQVNTDFIDAQIIAAVNNGAQFINLSYAPVDTTPTANDVAMFLALAANDAILFVPSGNTPSEVNMFAQYGALYGATVVATGGYVPGSNIPDPNLSNQLASFWALETPNNPAPGAFNAYLHDPLFGTDGVTPYSATYEADGTTDPSDAVFGSSFASPRTAAVAAMTAEWLSANGLPTDSATILAYMKANATSLAFDPSTISNGAGTNTTAADDNTPTTVSEVVVTAPNNNTGVISSGSVVDNEPLNFGDDPILVTPSTQVEGDYLLSFANNDPNLPTYSLGATSGNTSGETGNPVDSAYTGGGEASGASAGTADAGDFDSGTSMSGTLGPDANGGEVTYTSTTDSLGNTNYTVTGAVTGSHIPLTVSFYVPASNNGSGAGNDTGGNDDNNDTGNSGDTASTNNTDTSDAAGDSGGGGGSDDQIYYTEYF